MINIFACGDIVISSKREKIVSDELKKLISSANISICNFEGPIESKSAPIPKVGLHISQVGNAIKILKETGFNVLSLANNHIMDFGWEGLRTTLNNWSRCK
jgi:poly-gamma-glutamate synthesis protein (capsule biosynthesis protein)